MKAVPPSLHLDDMERMQTDNLRLQERCASLEESLKQFTNTANAALHSVPKRYVCFNLISETGDYKVW